jgi:hypothetical protein
MRRLRVIVFDARPVAFDKTASTADDPQAVAELGAWLRGELAQSDDVVVKDPRVGWFLGLWQRAVGDAGARTAQITMLRHPAEILTSARKSYGDWQTDASRAAAWLNVMLETERLTRGAPRAYIRYEDLLLNWRGEVERVGRTLELPLLTGIAPERAAAVDAFVDPSLHRARTGWEELEVPEGVRDLCERVYGLFLALAGPEVTPEYSYAQLDEAHEQYRRLYHEAEAITQPSVTAVRPRKRQPPPTLRMKLTRRIPKPVRARLRSLAGR